jgi:hypothetical protein
MNIKVSLSGCGWAKLNVVQKRWLVGRLAPLLILRSVGIVSFILALSFIVCTVVIGLLVTVADKKGGGFGAYKP